MIARPSSLLTVSQFDDVAVCCGMVYLTSTIDMVCPAARIAFCEHNIMVAEYALCERLILCSNIACCICTLEISCHQFENGGSYDEQEHEGEDELPLERVFH